MKGVFVLIVLGLISISASIAQSTNDILNLLISNKTITQVQADSIRAEAAIKQQESDANKKAFSVTTSKPIQFSGYAQVRYQNLDEKGKIDGFDIRRARLDLKGTISPYWGYRFQADFAGTTSKLLDIYGECKVFSYLNFTFGQFKIPFSMENLASSSKLELIDRSQVVEALVARGKDVIGNQNGRDIGLQVYGSLLKINDKPLVDYALGVFNGSGINISDKNEAKSIAWRMVFHPLKGLDVGGSYYNGWDNFGTIAKDSERSRIGFELKYEFNRLSVRSEYIKGKDADTKRFGWYGQVGYYIIPQKLQLLIKYDRFEPSTSKSGDISTCYVGVLNYNFNNWSRIQLGYTFYEEQQNFNTNNNIGVVQYQIGF